MIGRTKTVIIFESVEKPIGILTDIVVQTASTDHNKRITFHGPVNLEATGLALERKPAPKGAINHGAAKVMAVGPVSFDGAAFLVRRLAGVPIQECKGATWIA